MLKSPTSKPIAARHATRSRLIVSALTALVGVLTTAPALAQTAPNPPKVQKALEAMASAMTREQVGPVIKTGATVGNRMLAINYEPAPGIEAAFALKSLQETNWDRGICANKDALAFINRDAVTVRITFTHSGQPPVVVSEITSASCAKEASTGSDVSRMIEGISFAPKPTAEQAMVMIQAYIQTHFKDPDSAILKCGDVGEAAWIKPVLERRRYGYFISCEINGKNSYGGYTGYETFVFRMNGDEFERVDFYVDKAGLMESAK